MIVTVYSDQVHNYKDFDCGNESLNHYLKKKMGKESAKRLCMPFVLVDPEVDNKKVLGYYTLSPNSIPKQDLTAKYKKDNPYADVPVILLGRLAIDGSLHGKGWGEFLLLDALYNAFTSMNLKVGGYAVVVDPINQNAREFYKNYDFLSLKESNRMFITSSQLEELFS